MSKTMQAWAGELVGTFMFVTVGAGAVVLATSGLADYGVLGIALAHAFALGGTITVFAAISGSHFNPAVTLSAWIGRKISASEALGYVASQILGALAAGVVVRTIFSRDQWSISNIGAPGVGVNISSGKAFLIEMLLTFFLCMTIWGTGIDERGPRVGGFAIGTVLGGMILAFGPLTGVGLNPARYLGPAAVAGFLDNWWVYIAGPAIGGAAAGILYPLLFWGGSPFARIGGSPDVAPDTVSPAARKPAARKR